MGFGCTAKESLAWEERCCSERVVSQKGWVQHKIQGQVCIYYFSIMTATYYLSNNL